MSNVVVIGDSSSVGFGTRGRSYPVLVAESLESPLTLLADFGKTTRQALAEDLPAVAGCDPGLIILQTGMADSLLHPGRRVQQLLERFAPPTWHGVDGLERRAVYSSRRRTALLQRAGAAAKTTLKRLLVRANGWTRMTPDDYAACLDELLTGLEATGAPVVSIEIYRTDERIFPRQRATSAPFVAAHVAVTARHPGVVVVRPDEVLHRWDDFLGDHGHWNAAGHAKVAALVTDRLASACAAPHQDVTT